MNTFPHNTVSVRALLYDHYHFNLISPTACNAAPHSRFFFLTEKTQYVNRIPTGPLHPVHAWLFPLTYIELQQATRSASHEAMFGRAYVIAFTCNSPARLSWLCFRAENHENTIICIGTLSGYVRSPGSSWRYEFPNADEDFEWEQTTIFQALRAIVSAVSGSWSYHRAT